MLCNTLAKAKLQFNKNLQMYKVLVAFNVTEKTKKGTLKFPTEKKCAYVSGHIELQELGRVLNTAQQVLRTSNIIIVEAD